MALAAEVAKREAQDLPDSQPVTGRAGGEATAAFDVTVPATAAPGWESWLLVKLMYFGRVRYSEAVRLTIS